jgi:FkbM family methyltransferase
MGLLRALFRRLLLARHRPRHWRLRPDTLDARLFRHVVIDNEYRLPRRFRRDDVVLDIGAHTGSFALAALRRGAGRVVCCEPEPANAALLAENLAPYPAADVRCVAVWDAAGTLHLSNPLDRRNTGAAQVRAEGTPVEAVAFDDLVRAAPRVRLVKLDCEGAEWPIVLASREWERVEAVCGEYHLPPLIEQPAGWPRFSAALLVEALEIHGFRVELADVPRSRLPVGLFFGTRRVRE